MKKQRGFTLIELVITMAALALLVGIAVPSFQNFSTSNKQSTTINQLTGAFSLARNEAVTRNARITLAANGGDWATGWIMSETTAGTQIKLGQPIPTTVIVTSAGPTTVEFNSDGTLRTALGGGFSILLCDANKPAGPHGKTLTLIASGRYSVIKDTACP